MDVRLPVTPGQWAARIVVSAVTVIGGAAVCLGNDHHWQAKIKPIQIVGGGYPPIRAPAFDSIGGDLIFVAVPFYVLAALIVVFGTRLIPTVAALAAVSALT